MLAVLAFTPLWAVITVNPGHCEAIISCIANNNSEFAQAVTTTDVVRGDFKMICSKRLLRLQHFFFFIL